MSQSGSLDIMEARPNGKDEHAAYHGPGKRRSGLKNRQLTIRQPTSDRATNTNASTAFGSADWIAEESNERIAIFGNFLDFNLVVIPLFTMIGNPSAIMVT